MMLPHEVRIPPESVALEHGNNSYHLEAWRYLVGTVRALPEISLVFDRTLGMVCWSTYDLLVDGVRVALDISDYVLVDGAVGGYDHWLRFSYTPLFAPFPKIGSFPITSFLDWHEYERLTSELDYHAQVQTVVYGQRDHSVEGLPGGKTRRRRLVRELLAARYGAVLDDTWTDLEPFWRRAAASLVTVCVPGTNNHHLDRGQHQLLGLGICTISPDIFIAPLEDRLVRGRHYVACRDDYTDLTDCIEWCRENREACRAIGREAKQFFRSHSTPRAIWTYVGKRLKATA